ncbi:hypothetical protein Tco_1401426 [Tanacetum coccineum]
MFQPWRALTTIINLCLMGKTSGFKRPRAPVLQILWGVVNRAHIDYAERMWEEFTQGLLAAKTHLEDTEEAKLQKEPDTRQLQSTARVTEKGKRKDILPYHLTSSHEIFPPFMLEHGLMAVDNVVDKKCPSWSEVGLKTKPGCTRPGDTKRTCQLTGTLSSLQHLAKDFSFGDQFLNDKPSEADNEKTTADTEAESMVSVTIQQDISVFPPMTSSVIGPVPRLNSPNVHRPLPTTTTTTAATTTTTLPLPHQPQQGGYLVLSLSHRKINESVKEVVISSVKHAMRAPLRARFKDLPTSDMKEILLQRMLEENYDKGHANHRVAYEALQDSIRRDESEDFDVDKAQEETKKKSKQDSPKTPPGSPPSPPPPPPPPSGASGASGTTGASDSAQAPPPPPPSSSTHQGDQSTSTAAPSSSKTAASAEYSAWTMTDTRIKPSITTIPDDLYMDDETTADEQAYSSGDEVGRDHIPTVNLRQSW